MTQYSFCHPSDSTKVYVWDVISNRLKVPDQPDQVLEEKHLLGIFFYCLLEDGEWVHHNSIPGRAKGIKPKNARKLKNNFLVKLCIYGKKERKRFIEMKRGYGYRWLPEVTKLDTESTLPHTNRIVEDGGHTSEYVREGFGDTATMRERFAKGFLGREHIFGAIKGFAQNQKCGHIFLRGPLGVGKTACLAAFSKKFECPYYVHPHWHLRPDWQRIFRSLTTQIENRWHPAIAGERYDQPSHKGTFQHLRQVSKTADEPIFLVIDGLEDGYTAAPSWNFLQDSLPDNVFVVVSSGLESGKHDTDDPVLDLVLKPADKENLNTIHTFVLQYRDEGSIQALCQNIDLSIQRFADAITEKSGGNFLYAIMVLQDIQSGRFKSSMRDLPTGLPNYYQARWKHFKYSEFIPGLDLSVKRLWDAYQLPILRLLSLVTKPLTLTQIMHLANLEDRWLIGQILKRWAPMIREITKASDPLPGFMIDHVSFSNFLWQQGDFSAGLPWMVEQLARGLSEDFLGSKRRCHSSEISR